MPDAEDGYGDGVPEAEDGYGDGGPEAEDGYEDGGPEPSAATIKNVCFAFRKTHPKSHICNGLLGRARLRYGCSQARAYNFSAKTLLSSRYTRSRAVQP